MLQHYLRKLQPAYHVHHAQSRRVIAKFHFEMRLAVHNARWPISFGSHYRGVVLGRIACGNVFQIFRGGQSNRRANDGTHSRRTFYFICHRHYSRGYAYALGNVDNRDWNFRGFAAVLHLFFRSMDVAFAAPRSEAAHLTMPVAARTPILPIAKFFHWYALKKTERQL